MEVAAGIRLSAPGVAAAREILATACSTATLNIPTVQNMRFDARRVIADLEPTIMLPKRK